MIKKVKEQFKNNRKNNKMKLINKMFYLILFIFISCSTKKETRENANYLLSVNLYDKNDVDGLTYYFYYTELDNLENFLNYPADLKASFENCCIKDVIGLKRYKQYTSTNIPLPIDEEFNPTLPLKDQKQEGVFKSKKFGNKVISIGLYKVDLEGCYCSLYNETRLFVPYSYNSKIYNKGELKLSKQLIEKDLENPQYFWDLIINTMVR